MKTTLQILVRAAIVLGLWHAGQAATDALAGPKADALYLGLTAFFLLGAILAVGGFLDGWRRGSPWAWRAWLGVGFLAGLGAFVIPAVVSAIKYPDQLVSIWDQSPFLAFATVLYMIPGVLAALVGSAFHRPDVPSNG